MAYAWVLLFLASDFKFTTGRSPVAATTGSFSKENIVEALIYAGVLMGCMTRSRRSRSAGRLPLGPVVLLPSLAVASTAWSYVPVFTAIRSLQLFVPVLLARESAILWLESPDEGRRLFAQVLRWMLNAVAVLVAGGLIIRPWPNNRFTWPGAHPGVAAEFAAIGVIILVTTKPRQLGIRPFGALCRWLLFLSALLLSRSRGELIALVAACLVIVWVAGRTRPHFRYVATILSLCVPLAVATGPVFTYLRRGGSQRQLLQLNGRTPLWGVAYRSVVGAGRVLEGFGFGATRIVLYRQVSFAGNAHNAWIELFAALGLLGLLCGLLVVGHVSYHLLRPSAGSLVEEDRLVAGLLTFLIVLSVSSVAFALPGSANVLLAFLCWLAFVRRNERLALLARVASARRDEGPAPGAPRTAGDTIPTRRPRTVNR